MISLKSKLKLRTLQSNLWKLPQRFNQYTARSIQAVLSRVQGERKRSVFVYIILLIIGLSGLAFCDLLELNRISDEFLKAVSLSLITVCLYELLRITVALWIHRFEIAKKAEEFWGVPCQEFGARGLICLQSEETNTLRVHCTSGESTDEQWTSQRSSPRPPRALKARTWVNRWDAKGAREILISFREHRLDNYLPDIEYIRVMPDKDVSLASQDLATEEFVTRGKAVGDAPFIISMGLGFSKSSDAILNSISDWLIKAIDSEFGDCVYIREPALSKDTVSRRERRNVRLERLTENEQRRLTRGAPSSRDDFCRLIPIDWTLDGWLKSRADNASQDGSQLRDYALIVRNTIQEDSTGKVIQVQFLLGGFTEVGTAAAGAYLARNWLKLWGAHVKDKINGQSRGDFVVIISGIGCEREFANWEIDDILGVMTPHRLSAERKIDCEWGRRIDDR